MTCRTPDASLGIRWMMAGLLALSGCQQKMAAQPSLRPDQPTGFLPGGTSCQKPVEGTVARGHLRTDFPLFTGRRAPFVPLATTPPAANELGNTNRDSGDQSGTLATLLAGEMSEYEDVVDELPIPLSLSTVQHGRDRYMIYCVVCHDAAGTGHGKIVERGYTEPPSYHIDRLRRAPSGHLFRVISDGYGSMPSYAEQIPARDRWAIVAYVRALQLSQHCPVAAAAPAIRESGAASD